MPCCWCLDRYHRIEVLGALASVLSTWLVTGVLVYEAIDRIRHPVQVNGKCTSACACHVQAAYDYNLAISLNDCILHDVHACSCTSLQLSQ